MNLIELLGITTSKHIDNDRAIQLLRQDVVNLPEIPAMSQHENSPADEKWLNNRRKIRNYILNYDPRKFLRWDVIQETMYVIGASYIPFELQELERQGQWEDRWKDAIIEPITGKPILYKDYKKSSENAIHHAYTLSQFEIVCNKKVDTLDTIIEFGGGFGSVCRLCHHLGFNGRYIIFDLPEFGALQKYYLRNNDIEIAESLDNFQHKGGVFCTSDLSDLNMTLPNKNSLFVGMWSISETSLSFRESVLSSSMIRSSEYCLIAYQAKFEEVDNEKFFTNLITNTKHLDWEKREIKHLPGNTYVYGKGRDMGENFSSY